MYTLFAFLAALSGLFLWVYIVSYMMYSGVQRDFIQKVRSGVLRGMGVAAIFVFFQYMPELNSFVHRDWVLFPMVFLFFSLPFSWQRIRASVLLPLVLSFVAWFSFSFSDERLSYLFWTPFHEEIGKWYQAVTLSYPAMMSPFVSLGFGFLENFRYFSYDMSITQILGRTLFSLPFHLFVGLLAFWFFLSIPSRLIGVLLGLVAAIAVHLLYNWSLDTSILATLVIIILGYMFYGWSLENGWWKKGV